MKKKCTVLVFLLFISLFAWGCANHSEEGRPSPEKQVEVQPSVNDVSPGSLVKPESESTDKIEDAGGIPPEESDETLPGETGEKERALEDSQNSAEDQKNNPAPVEVRKQVRLVLTHDYGKEVIFDSKIPLNKTYNALELTSSKFDIETAYGGSFVNAINGVRSGYTSEKGRDKIKHDWFLYYNGILAPTGAGSIKLEGGDVVWWDYHDWGGSTFTPAMIGAFPQPLAKAVEIAYSQSGQDLAVALADNMKDREFNVEAVEEYDERIINKRSSPSIIVGIWNELDEYPAIKKLNENNPKTGIFCKFTPEGLQKLNSKMQGTTFIYQEGSAVIAATASGLGDTNPLWLVIGYDREGLEKAIELLMEGKLSAHYGWGILLNPEGGESLPGE